MYSTDFINKQENWIVQPKMLTKQSIIAISILLLFHISGFIGIAFTANADWFLSYTPLNLLVAMSCMIWSQGGKNRDFWVYLVVCGIAGWFIECLGVHTGFPFGDYHYHETLGLQLFGIPLMTGVIWWLTCFGAAAIATEMANSTYSRVLLAALLMVVFDIPVEHVSGKMGMWHWQNGFAPIQNYLGWFVFGVILQYILHTLNIQKRNATAIAYFIIAFIFFMGLDIISW